jgi:hypothetical protein
MVNAPSTDFPLSMDGRATPDLSVLFRLNFDRLVVDIDENREIGPRDAEAAR